MRTKHKEVTQQLRDGWNPLDLGNLNLEQTTEGVKKEINSETLILFNKNLHTGTSIYESF